MRLSLLTLTVCGLFSLSGAMAFDGDAKAERKDPSDDERVEIKAPATASIAEIVKDSQRVRRGDLLVRLAGLTPPTANQARIETEMARSKMVAAEAKFQESRGAGVEQLTLAQSQLKVAELRRRSFVGSFELKLKLVERKGELSRKALAFAQRRLKDSSARAKAGKMLAEELLVLELEVEKARIEVEAVELSKKQLVEFDKPLKEGELDLEVTEAQFRVARVQRESERVQATSKAELNAVQMQFAMQIDRAKKLESRQKRLSIMAPVGGVVKLSPNIKAGAAVRAGQLLLVVVKE